MGLECREDGPVREQIVFLQDHVASLEIAAERSFLERLGSGCYVPVGARATAEGEYLRLTGVVAHPDGTELFHEEISGAAANGVFAASVGVVRASAPVPGVSTVIARGSDSLIISSARLMLREVELERVNATTCPDPIHYENDCREFKAGPVLLSLPLGGGTAVAVTLNAPPDQYDELEFEFDRLHRSKDTAFLPVYPEFADASIRVQGVYVAKGDRRPFSFFADIESEHEIELVPPLRVVDGDVATLSVRVDLSHWFVDRFGRLVDPNTANEDGPNEAIVARNIRRSLDAFRAGLLDDEEVVRTR